jgi:KaiC/GvpD/RAD55 family RecA-like ATPase
MAYALGVEEAPETVPDGSGVLLVHPSTSDADRFETAFLTADEAPALLISTHSAAEEVKQKVEHYGVDPHRVEVLDTISVERGYTRRQSADVTYLSAPDDLEGLREATANFLERQGSPARISLDSITELAYYADAEPLQETLVALLDLLGDHDAVGLFQLAADGSETVDPIRDRFAGVLEVDADGSVTASF